MAKCSDCGEEAPIVVEIFAEGSYIARCQPCAEVAEKIPANSEKKEEEASD